MACSGFSIKSDLTYRLMFKLKFSEDFFQSFSIFSGSLDFLSGISESWYRFFSSMKNSGVRF